MEYAGNDIRIIKDSIKKQNCVCMYTYIYIYIFMPSGQSDFFSLWANQLILLLCYSNK